MSLRRLAAAAVVAGTLLTLAPSILAQAVQRAMYVSVLNEAGAPVPGLGPADFIIREDNVAREVLRVAPATEPMQVALLLDNSVAARNAIMDIRNASTAFVTALTTPSESSGRNEVAIITLADRPTTTTDFTFSRAALLKGIERIFPQPNSGMTLLQAIIDVSKQLKKRGAMRPVIVAVATEGPELSDRFHDLVIDALRDSGAAFHAVIIGAQGGGGLGTNARERGLVLDEGTRASGGRYDNILTSMALPDKLSEVATELTHQYRVTYAHPQSLIPPDKVTVATNRPGLTARGTLAKDAPQGRP